jgi:uncharacterized protein YydD (DUF2326 family)
MILGIESSIPTFKSVRLRAGLNVLLADAKSDSTDKQTRNSAGKTSFVEIVHFLLGANCDKDSLFRSPALIQHSFKGTFSIGGERFTVQRSGSEPAKIFLLEGGHERDDLPKRTDKESERLFVSNTNWRVFLGHAMFGMPGNLNATIFEEPGSPTFRAMFSYFARRRNSGGFLHPERQAEQQQRADWQVNLSYLLGLDWQIPFEFQKVRDRESALEELRRAAKAGTFGDFLGTVAELRPQLTIAEAKAERLRAQLVGFEVLESYRDMARRAARAKTEMQALSREAISLHETIEHLERALISETPPDKLDLERLYAAAGIEIPGISLRRYTDVARFYSSIIGNRRAHLEQEMIEVRVSIADGERRLGALDRERREILKTLEGRGALEDFLSLQRELAIAESSAATLRERFNAAEILEGKTTQLDLDRVNLKRRLQEDHQARKAALDEAIIIISDTIGELYDDRSGRFVVEATENGPQFHISIEGDRGSGISNMEIFCMDFALFKLVTKRFGGPGFLVHDSHIFDGVDERQIARALLLGHNNTKDRELQYIVTMNSDIFDRLPLADAIDRTQVVLPTRLSDETDTGGLFGFRFS